VRAQEGGVEAVVRGEVHRDLVLALRVDQDARCGRRHRHDFPARIEAFVGREAARSGAERVVAERAEETRVHALAPARDRLVEALAAGAGGEGERAPGLARQREAVDDPRMVLHVAADHDHARTAHGHVSCRTWSARRRSSRS
jgi:hypothetical protein